MPNSDHVPSSGGNILYSLSNTYTNGNTGYYYDTVQFPIPIGIQTDHTHTHTQQNVQCISCTHASLPLMSVCQNFPSLMPIIQLLILNLVLKILMMLILLRLSLVLLHLLGLPRIKPAAYPVQFDVPSPKCHQPLFCLSF
jgi:hypothetical protein